MTDSVPQAKLLCSLCYKEMTPGYIAVVDGQAYHQACAAKVQNSPYIQKLKKIEANTMKALESIEEKKSTE